ncbi:hypothetical protein ACU686_03300 [Yinghuangia aomiensis]
MVFAWWVRTRGVEVDRAAAGEEVPGVEVRHIDHCNPAAQGDIFCDGDHFAMVNDALASLGAEPIDWLPSAGGTTPRRRRAGRMRNTRSGWAHSSRPPWNCTSCTWSAWRASRTKASSCPRSPGCSTLR